MSTELLVLAGERTSAADGGSSSVIEPGTGEPMTEVAEASAEDAKRAVDVAVKAFEEGAWRHMNATERGRVLLRASTLFRDRLENFAAVESRNAGKPINAARGEMGIVDGDALCVKRQTGIGRRRPALLPGRTEVSGDLFDRRPLALA